jgi:hypothetical protein
VRRTTPLLLGALALTACGKLQGFGGAAPPLVSFSVDFTGDVSTFRLPSVALVWGAQWLTEPFCVLPPENFNEPAMRGLPTPASSPADVIAQGCRDTFGFVANVVAQSVPLEPSGPTTLTLQQLPTADVMVGDVTARVAYGSLVVFDDVDGGGLQLAFPHRTPTGGRGGEEFNKEMVDSPDIVYGASFVTMTAPDRRVAYHEGGPVTGAFYPLVGCPALGPAFSIVGGSGFTPAEAASAELMGLLPSQHDPSLCFVGAPDMTTTTVTAQAPADVEEVACSEQTADSSVRYRQPPSAAPDLSGGRLWTCAHLPTFDVTNSQLSSLIQLVITGRTTDRCKGLTHYTLRGCTSDVNCPNPGSAAGGWDLLANPPTWWPCP